MQHMSLALGEDLVFAAYNDDRVVAFDITSGNKVREYSSHLGAVFALACTRKVIEPGVVV